MSILPVIKVISCLIVHGIFIIIMVLMTLAFRRWPMISWIGVAYYSFCLSVFSLAIIYITCAINVFFKDMSQIVGIALQFVMWMTPIMWDPSMFQDFPANVEKIMKLNPVYYIVVGYRDSMLRGNFFFQRPGLTLYFWAVTLLLLILGLRMFNKLRPHFSDVL